ncbi:MAG: IS30 family transposase, partial [Trichloromonadaceae bacterium]
KTSGRMGESSERFQVGDRHIDQHLHVITASYEDLRLQRPDTSDVENKLRDDWPPEVIAYRVRADHPDDERMRVSHETIYRWVFLDAGQGGTLYRHLHRRRKHRRRQKRYGAGRRFIPGRVGIEERPEVVAQRSRFGDWEGDLILGRRRSGAIATHVERKSRYLMAELLPDRKADTFNEAAIPAYQALPKHLCQTLTLDNGKEFSRFKELEAKTGLSVYFAAPYSAWQRGTNENTNGLLRFYFPKGTNFKRISARALAKAVHKLNNRPRKCLGYRTPQEVYAEACCGALAI